jgi:hypothetical protein
MKKLLLSTLLTLGLLLMKKWRWLALVSSNYPMVITSNSSLRRGNE